MILGIKADKASNVDKGLQRFLLKNLRDPLQPSHIEDTKKFNSWVYIYEDLTCVLRIHLENESTKMTITTIPISQDMTLRRYPRHIENNDICNMAVVKS